VAGEHAFFEKLVRDVQLGSAAYTDASGKHDRVRRCLNRHYYSHDSGSANSFLVGSYGKNTEIRPPSDIDILFELPPSVWTRYQNRTGNIQSALLQEVKGVLLNSFSTTAICGDGQIVSVPFVTYAVEVLPAFRTQDGRYLHADSNGGGRWRTTHPKQEISDLTTSNAATGGKTIHLVKLAKAWKAARNVAIKSFVLELAAVKFLAQWQHNRLSTGDLSGYGFYDWMMRDFFRWLEGQTNQSWWIPGATELVHTGNAWEAQARFAAAAADRACTHHSADRPVSAKGEWKNVFGDYVA
jgi:hypothetical protein